MVWRLEPVAKALRKREFAAAQGRVCSQLPLVELPPDKWKRPACAQTLFISQMMIAMMMIVPTIPYPNIKLSLSAATLGDTTNKSTQAATPKRPFREVAGKRFRAR